MKNKSFVDSNEPCQKCKCLNVINIINLDLNKTNEKKIVSNESFTIFNPIISFFIHLKIVMIY